MGANKTLVDHLIITIFVNLATIEKSKFTQKITPERDF